jgi:hypothetical protein
MKIRIDGNIERNSRFQSRGRFNQDLINSNAIPYLSSKALSLPVSNRCLNRESKEHFNEAQG